MNRLFRPALAATGVALLALAATAQTAAAKDIILTAAKPNQLIVADAATRQVLHTWAIPGNGTPMTVMPSPDGKVAYMTTNRWESVIGLEIDTGKVVFQADLSDQHTRVKNTFAADISPDGSEIAVFEEPVKLLADRYEVQPTRVCFYKTSAGLKAKRDRCWEAPRRTAQMFYSPDGGTLYLGTWDIQAHDPKTGELLKTYALTNWDRPNYFPPDVFGVWSQYEQAATYVNPYFTLRSDKSMDDPDAWKTGMVVLDLKTGEFKAEDFESTSGIIFSTAMNPVKRDEVYGVYTQLYKIDIAKNETVKKIDLPHTYYAVNVSTDGKELYVGGTMDDIGVYDTETFERIGEIRLPSGNDMGVAWMRIIKR